MDPITVTKVGLHAAGFLRKHWKRILTAIVVLLGTVILIPTVIFMGIFGFLPVPSDDVKMHYSQVAKETGVKEEYLIYFDTVKYHNHPRSLEEIKKTSKVFLKEEEKISTGKDGKNEVEVVVVYLTIDQVMDEQNFTKEERNHMLMLLQLNERSDVGSNLPGTISDGGTDEIILPIKNSTFIWPAPQINGITDYFRSRKNPVTGVQETHRGVDLASGNDNGKKIIASREGTVVVAEFNKFCGNMIQIRHDDTYQTKYCHCSKIFVKKGQKVPQGYVIGAVGSTGNSTGPHLHFGIEKNGKLINPLPYIIDTKP